MHDQRATESRGPRAGPVRRARNLTEASPILPCEKKDSKSGWWLKACHGGSSCLVACETSRHAELCVNADKSYANDISKYLAWMLSFSQNNYSFDVKHHDGIGPERH
eukprot:758814-Hanusia_phi.AAC.1